jgi:hypothetical protein
MPPSSVTPVPTTVSVAACDDRDRRTRSTLSIESNEGQDGKKSILLPS